MTSHEKYFLIDYITQPVQSKITISSQAALQDPRLKFWEKFKTFSAIMVFWPKSFLLANSSQVWQFKASDAAISALTVNISSKDFTDTAVNIRDKDISGVQTFSFSV